MKSTKNSRYILKVIIHCQQVRLKSNESGYALLISSVLSILTFSMLSVFIFSTNLYKSVSNTVLESGSTFYAAESAMNKRAYEVRQKFRDYENPTGNSPTKLDGTRGTVAEQMAICTGAPGNKGSGDMQCKEITTDYTSAVIEYDEKGNLVQRTKGKKKSDGSFADSKDSNNVKYHTYSFVRDITNYNSTNTVDLTRIKEGDYAGLNAQEYTYRVYTSAAKETNLGAGINKGIDSQTMLQMDFNNRLIPLFQFAAFYENDLEITSSSNMDLFGPVHTNSNLRLAPGGMLRLQGNVTSRLRIYKALEFTAGHGWVGTPNHTIRIMGGGPDMSSENAWNNGSGGSTANETSSRITQTELDSHNKLLKENQPRLRLPPAGVLTRAADGEYHQKADLIVYFHPLSTDPFGKIELVRSTASGTDFSAPMLRSLQQPVLAVPQVRNGEFTPISEYTRLCPKADGSEGEPANIAETTPSPSAGMTAAQIAILKANSTAASTARTTLRNALNRAMIGNSTQLTSFSDTKLAATGNLRTNLTNALPSAGLLGISRNTLRDTNLDVLADAAGGCYLPPPMQVLQGADYVERREGGRLMNILQSNIKSLTVWNRDGFYNNGSGFRAPAADKLFVRQPTAVPPSGATSRAATNCDYECMGLAPADQTNGGLVWHFSIEKGKAGFPGYTYNSGNGTARAGESPFGFAFSGGNRLPGALTIASDQAIYVQGDYNNPSNTLGDLDTALDGNQIGAIDINREKRPASLLGDTISVLSNSCLDANKRINCLRPLTTTESTTPWGSNTNLPIASNTVVRAAFLARTDVSSSNGTENSGGLNNYMRMVENWGGGLGATFKYRGSFVSLGRPQEFSGVYRGGSNTGATAPTNTNGTFYNIPIRDFGFDTNLNNQLGLPPLTPRVVSLKQKVFKRDYDRSDRSGNK
jgi:hypothetical protein